MADRSKGEELVEQGMFAGAAARANPLGDLLYVDPTNGNSGNDGKSELQAVTTLARAIALAGAGDTIIVVEGGTETLSSPLAVTQAGLRIICLADNMFSGYEINGPTALASLMLVSAANVHLEGLKFTRDAEAGTAKAQLLTTAGADYLRVKNCLFDHSAFSSSWIGYGIELTDDLLHPHISGCKFVDNHRGILFTIASGKTQLGFHIHDNEFLVGQATAFGIHNNPTSTGVSQLGRIEENLFREMKGSGAAASNWDGTAADGTAGPYLLGALCDQFVSRQNVGDSVSGLAFDVLPNVSGTGKLIDNMTTVVSDDSAAVASVGLATSTDTLSVGTAVSVDNLSVGVAASTDTLSVGTAASTDTLSVGVLVTAIGAGPFASSVALATQVTATSTDVLSVGTLVSAIGTVPAATSAALSTHTIAMSTDVLSTGALDTTNATSVGVIASTDTLSVGALVTGQGAAVHATSAALSTQVLATSTDVLSVGALATSGSTSAGLSTQVLATSTDTLSVGVVAATATGAGSDIVLSKTIASTSIADNAQSFALFVASGSVWVDEIFFQKDASNMTGPTNLELTVDNVAGPTGLTTDFFKNILAGFNANLSLAATGGATTAMTPFLLEAGKSIFMHGDDAAGAGGNVNVTLIGRRGTAGASLA